MTHQKLEGGVAPTPSLGFCGVTTNRKYFSCKGNGTAGGPLRHPRWLIRWILGFTKKKNQLYRKNAKKIKPC